MTFKNYIILTAVLLAVTALVINTLAKQKWQAAYFKQEAEKTAIVQQATQARAALEAKHTRELQAAQAERERASLASQAAQAAANKIQIRTAEEIAAIRSSTMPDKEKVATLLIEIDIRGQKIAALELAITKKDLELGVASETIQTMIRQVGENKQAVDKNIAALTAQVAKTLILETELRKRIILYAGIGPAYTPTGIEYFSVHAGVGILIKRIY